MNRAFCEKVDSIATSTSIHLYLFLPIVCVDLLGAATSRGRIRSAVLVQGSD